MLVWISALNPSIGSLRESMWTASLPRCSHLFPPFGRCIEQVAVVDAVSCLIKSSGFNLLQHSQRAQWAHRMKNFPLSPTTERTGIEFPFCLFRFTLFSEKTFLWSWKRQDAGQMKLPANFFLSFFSLQIPWISTGSNDLFPSSECLYPVLSSKCLPLSFRPNAIMNVFIKSLRQELITYKLSN